MLIRHGKWGLHSLASFLSRFSTSTLAAASRPSLISLPFLSSCASVHCGCCHPVPATPGPHAERSCMVFFSYLWRSAAGKASSPSGSQRGERCQPQPHHRWKDTWPNKTEAAVCKWSEKFFLLSKQQRMGWLRPGASWRDVTRNEAKILDIRLYVIVLWEVLTVEL